MMTTELVGGEATMNEQDWRAVETMVLSGLDLEALYAVFPNFAREAIKRVYETVKPVTRPEKTPVKANCS